MLLRSVRYSCRTDSDSAALRRFLLHAFRSGARTLTEGCAYQLGLSTNFMRLPLLKFVTNDIIPLSRPVRVRRFLPRSPEFEHVNI